jgi:hypothetical protein
LTKCHPDGYSADEFRKFRRKAMKKLTVLVAAAALTSAVAGGVAAEEKIKPLTVQKSTQALPPVSLGGLGGLGAVGTLAVIGGVVTFVVITQTSGT